MRLFRPERVAGDEARDLPALRDPLALVERPVDAEVDAALAVFFLRLRERREAPRMQPTVDTTAAHYASGAAA